MASVQPAAALTSTYSYQHIKDLRRRQRLPCKLEGNFSLQHGRQLQEQVITLPLCQKAQEQLQSADRLHVSS